MKRRRSKMKIGTMNRNVLKDPRHKDFNYNTIALPFFGFFNETTLSWQLKQTSFQYNLQRQVLSKERATLIWTEWSTIQEVTSRNIPEQPKKPGTPPKKLGTPRENSEHPEKKTEISKSRWRANMSPRA